MLRLLSGFINPKLLRPQSAGFMNLYPVAKRIADKKSLPRRRTPILRDRTRRLQPFTQSIDIRAFQSEMPVSILPCARFLDRQVHVQTARVKPHTAATAN